ncbi:hypothetical protein SDC9_198337 [bioreactor metagenome]|uniref:Uncharacterized protein n=1 Tax=bioreactor metagenome TaxID=1076179 RepID=A0A645IQS4_9ZZZZ
MNVIVVEVDVVTDGIERINMHKPRGICVVGLRRSNQTEVPARAVADNTNREFRRFAMVNMNGIRAAAFIRIVDYGECYIARLQWEQPGQPRLR